MEITALSAAMAPVLDTVKTAPSELVTERFAQLMAAPEAGAQRQPMRGVQRHSFGTAQVDLREAVVHMRPSRSRLRAAGRAMRRFGKIFTIRPRRARNGKLRTIGLTRS